ncbi:MAG: histidinol-phosphate transaminase [Desulfomonilaceae bacterium]
MEAKRPSWIEQRISPHILSIPPYVPGKPVAELARELGIPEAIKMASNENPLGPSPMAVKAVGQHLLQSHVYPESSAPELRAALASRFGLSPDSIVLGNGSDEIMEMIAHVFLQPGDEAVMAENAFSMYRICVEAFGGKAVRVALRDYRSDLNAMASAVTERTKLVFLAVPNSPTGTIVSCGEFESFLKDLPKGWLVLVLDEAYREYVQELDCPSGVDFMDGESPILVLRTFSKIYGLAGLRVGYGLGHPWLIELLNRVRPPFNVNTLAQVAAVAALNDVEHLNRSRAITHSGMAYIVKELNEMGLETIPSQANFISFCWDRNAEPLYEALLREGVIVRHLGSFGMEKCIRVTVGTEDENRRFIVALKKTLPRIR